MRSDWTARDVGTLVAGILFILLGAWMIRQSFAMSTMGAVFPRTIAGVMIICSIVLVIQRLLRRPGLPTEHIPGESPPRMLGLIATMAVWVLLIPVVGFFATSLVAFVVLLAVANYDGWNTRRALSYGAVAVLVVGTFYLVFVELLLVPTPRGLLF
ncbi:MAG TPA: tripartite tricarboxylate transporter TctB family protein [Arenibaculum sp.]|nr:tripartite tricarboxylate transporter TctB family protein [Arenibaculum sp.]